MFTGIIQGIGVLKSTVDCDSGKRLEVDISLLSGIQPKLGDSIAINGACLTISGFNPGLAAFHVSSETLSKCLIKEWKLGDLVNLEQAVTLQTPLGGHLISGHIDGTAEVGSICSSSTFTEMTFRINSDLGKFVAVKGSIAIDGVSLTINHVFDSQNKTEFTTMLVPHTLANTTLDTLLHGDKVHVEVDQIARYIHRLGQF